MSQLCLKLLHDHLQCQNNTVVDSFRNYSRIYNLQQRWIKQNTTDIFFCNCRTGSRASYFFVKLCAHRDAEGFCWWKTEDTFTWLALGIFIVQFHLSKENPSKCFLQALSKMDV